MNNARLAVEEINMEIELPVDTTPMLREKALKIEKILEAFEKINGSIYWKVLKEEIFDGVMELLQRRMRNEKDHQELIRLQGQLIWAEKYCDLDKMAEIYRKELINLTNKI
jgi:hypothetical protein